LLVFDRDFVYGQSFYLALTPEAKERILNVGRRCFGVFGNEAHVFSVVVFTHILFATWRIVGFSTLTTYRVRTGMEKLEKSCNKKMVISRP